MAGPTWVIDTANQELGVPETAHCEACGQTWTRPVDDRWADTLPAFGRFHNHECHGRQLRLVLESGDNTGELEPGDVVSYYMHQGWQIDPGGRWHPPK
jgi:hypothetical protein